MIKPQNFPETIIWYYIILTYIFYFLGIQLIGVTILASVLSVYLLWKCGQQTDITPPAEKIYISSSAWVWILCMLAIEIALIVNHSNSNFGIFATIRSSYHWYRTWGLLALFTLIGHLNIRPQLIYRAICILCAQSSLMIFIGFLVQQLKIPNIIYTSPLLSLCGSPELCRVIVFPTLPTIASASSLDRHASGLDTLTGRLSLFAPWPTYLALLGIVYFLVSLREKHQKLRLLSIFTSTIMIVASLSRAATLALPVILFSVWFLTNIIRPWLQIFTGLSCFISGFYFSTLLNYFNQFREQIDNARAGSSEARAILFRMTIYRWWNEAPIWGHGIGQAGPILVGKIHFGSHQTWSGILYFYGIVGGIALGFAFVWSFIDLLVKAQKDETSKLGLSILFALFIGSLVDNIDYFAYLFWPGLILLGIAFKGNLQKENLNILQRRKYLLANN